MEYILFHCIFVTKHAKYAVLACGFNQNLTKYTKLVEKYSLCPVLSEGTGTNIKVDHLDQNFTNLIDIKYQTNYWDITDHSSIFFEAT